MLRTRGEGKTGEGVSMEEQAERKKSKLTVTAYSFNTILAKLKSYLRKFLELYLWQARSSEVLLRSVPIASELQQSGCSVQ